MRVTTTANHPDIDDVSGRHEARDGGLPWR
jgi:hypothetical protein